MSVNFEVSKTPEGSNTKVEPRRVRQMAMCLRGSWYTISAKDGTFPAEDPVKSLDVQVNMRRGKAVESCWGMAVATGV